MNKKIISLSVLSLLFSVNAFSADKGYVAVDGGFLKTSDGSCVITSGDNKPQVECGDVIPVIKPNISVVKVDIPVVVEEKKKEIIDLTILFNFDKHTLSAKQKEVLTDYFDKLEISSISIKGYTDTIGNKNYNQKLSSLRAKSVQEFLLSIGVNSITSVEGLGENYPVVDCDPKTIKCEQPNRRVVVTIKE